MVSLFPFSAFLHKKQGKSRFWPSFGVHSTQTLVEIYNKRVSGDNSPYFLLLSFHGTSHEDITKNKPGPSLYLGIMWHIVIQVLHGYTILCFATHSIRLDWTHDTSGCYGPQIGVPSWRLQVKQNLGSPALNNWLNKWIWAVKFI